MGRPSKYKPGIAQQICEALASGKSMREVCKAKDFPDERTIYRWLEVHEEFRQQYAHARERQADAIFSEILDIADDGSRDTYTDEDGNERTDHDVVQRSRLRVDARKWVVSKLAPKKYGDKIAAEVSGPDGGAIELDVNASSAILAKLGVKG